MARTKNFWPAGLGLVMAGAVAWGWGMPPTGSSKAEEQPAAPGIACPTGPGLGAGKEPIMEVSSPAGEAPRALPPLDAARPDRTEVAVFALG